MYSIFWLLCFFGSYQFRATKSAKTNKIACPSLPHDNRVHSLAAKTKSNSVTITCLKTFYNPICQANKCQTIEKIATFQCNFSNGFWQTASAAMTRGKANKINNIFQDIPGSNLGEDSKSFLQLMEESILPQCQPTTCPSGNRQWISKIKSTLLDVSENGEIRPSNRNDHNYKIEFYTARHSEQLFDGWTLVLEFVKPIKKGQIRISDQFDNLFVSSTGKIVSFTSGENNRNLVDVTKLDIELHFSNVGERLSKFSVKSYPFEFKNVDCLENEKGTLVLADGELWDQQSNLHEPKKTTQLVHEKQSVEDANQALLNGDQEHSDSPPYIITTSEPITTTSTAVDQQCFCPACLTESNDCICQNGLPAESCKYSGHHMCTECFDGFELYFDSDSYLCKTKNPCAEEMTTTETPLNTENLNLLEILSDQRPLEDSQCWSGSFKYNCIYMTHGINWSNDLFLDDLKSVIDMGYNIIFIGYYLAAWWPQATDAHAQWLNLSDNDRDKILDYAHAKGAKILLSMGGSADEIDGSGGVIETDQGKLYGNLGAKAVLDGKFDGLDFSLQLKKGNSWVFKTGKMQQFMQNSLREARKYLRLGKYVITHSPIGPYLSDWASMDNSDDRGYFQWMIDNQYNIDFMNIQYFDQGTYLDFNSIFIDNYYFKGSAIRSLIDAGIHPEKLVIGKPNGLNMARNGYIDPTLLQKWGCQAYNYDRVLGFRGGFSTYYYDKTNVGSSHFWSQTITTQCEGIPLPSHIENNLSEKWCPQIIQDQKNLYLDIAGVNNENHFVKPNEDENILFNDDGFTCEKIGRISTTTEGWDAGGTSWRWVSSVEYDIPSDKMGIYYLLVEFTKPVKAIKWWQWKDERDPPDGPLNESKTIWKLRGQDSWWVGKPRIEFEMQPTDFEID